MPNRFKTPALRKQYDACVKCYRSRHRDLVRPDGTPHLGNGWASHFWRGYKRTPLNWDAPSRKTFAYACYRAGEDMRQSDEEEAELRRAIGSPQLPNSLQSI